MKKNQIETQLNREIRRLIQKQIIQNDILKKLQQKKIELNANSNDNKKK